MTMLTYGVLPDATAIVEACDGPYPIGNVHAMPAIVEAVNQGIDSRLEAVFFTMTGEAGLDIEARSMPVLIRRLVEMWENGNEGAGDDASAILGTLGWEWI
jgi:hypothetical protein